MDETCRWYIVIQQEDQKQTFLDYINKVDPTIKFTVWDNQENGTIPFLDTLVKPEADNCLSITVYRKPMYTDEYLQWDSHHNLAAKYSAISTLTHRARTVWTRPELLNKGIHHLREVLAKSKYPKWALDKVERKLFSNWENSKTLGEPREEDNKNPSSTPTRINTVRDLQ